LGRSGVTQAPNNTLESEKKKPPVAVVAAAAILAALVLYRIVRSLVSNQSAGFGNFFKISDVQVSAVVTSYTSNEELSLNTLMKRTP
jgi:hypothetical protein